MGRSSFVRRCHDFGISDIVLRMHEDDFVFPCCLTCESGVISLHRCRGNGLDITCDHDTIWRGQIASADVVGHLLPAWERAASNPLTKNQQAGLRSTTRRTHEMEDSIPPDAMPPTKTPISLTHRLFTSRADSKIAHLNRILSTSSGVEKTLMLASYTLVLVHSQLHRLLTLNLTILAERLAASASKSLRPGDTIITTMPLTPTTSRLADLHASAKAAQAVVADVRIFLRLWGLLGVWAWARGTYYDGPEDAVLRGVAWGQIVVNTGYYVYEHAAYLASKNVLRGVSAERQNKWWLISGRCFAGHVLLDFARLWRVRQLRGERVGSEKEDKVAREKADALWWRQLCVDSAYAPLVVHWSLAQGFVSDSWYGLLGTLAATVGFREAWKQTA